MNADLCLDIAAYACGARYDQLPLDAIEAAKKSLVDTLGVMLAASGLEPAAANVLAFVREMGGREESSVIGLESRVPAVWAAFANGALAHCMDFDDLTPWGSHASSSIIPAVLAIAEQSGHVTGKELITSIAIGQDLFARLLRNVKWRKDWNPSTVLGVFAATVAAGRLIGLPRDRMAHALSIANMQSSGTMEVVYGVGGDLRGMYAAFSAKSAVLSVLLAARSITGPATAFEGQAGFFKTYFRDDYQREQMLEGLGTEFLGGTTLYKPWPAVGPAHSHIHATITLVTNHHLAPADIEQIRVHVGDYQQIMSSPLGSRQRPTTPVDAKFSLPFLVAVAAVHRAVTLAHFTQEALLDEAVLDMCQRIEPVADATFDWKSQLPSGRVEILTRDGRRFDLVGDDVPGSLKAPLTFDAITAKFNACASLAKKPPTFDRLASFERLARNLETVEDVGSLLRLLV